MERGLMTVMSLVGVCSMITDVDAVDGCTTIASESIEELLIGGTM